MVATRAPPKRSRKGSRKRTGKAMRPFASIVTALIPRNSTVYPPCPSMEALISTFFHYSPSIATIGTQENAVKHGAQAKIL